MLMCFWAQETEMLTKAKMVFLNRKKHLFIKMDVCGCSWWALFIEISQCKVAFNLETFLKNSVSQILLLLLAFNSNYLNMLTVKMVCTFFLFQMEEIFIKLSIMTILHNLLSKQCYKVNVPSVLQQKNVMYFPSTPWLLYIRKIALIIKKQKVE